MNLLSELRWRWCNRRSARNTIAVLQRLGIQPAQLVDAGANESQWARYLAREWPGLNVISFEPLPAARPLGFVYRHALGEANTTIRFVVSGKQSHATNNGHAGIEVPCVRFDSLRLPIARPAVLKVDCENMTLPALRGFGVRLREFVAVHVELSNRAPFENRIMKIYNLMAEHGFNRSEMMDSIMWPSGMDCADALFWKEL